MRPLSRGTGRPSKYKLADGTIVPGVTTITGRFKESGGLLHWAWSQGMEGIDYRRTRDDAGEAGTMAHSMIEAEIHGEPWTAPPHADHDIVAKAETSLTNFRRWAAQTGLRITATELPLIDEENRFGGTLDAIGEVMGTLCLVDWKTSNGVYPDYLVQVSAYVHLYELHHPGVQLDGVHLLRVDKEVAGFHHHHWGRSVTETGWEFFRLARQLYELDKALKRAA